MSCHSYDVTPKTIHPEPPSPLMLRHLVSKQRKTKRRIFSLVHTKTVYSVFHALCLATQTWDSISCSPQGIFARQISLISWKKGTIWGWLSTGLV